jgi:hypothetical protein
VLMKEITLRLRRTAAREKRELFHSHCALAAGRSSVCAPPAGNPFVLTFRPLATGPPVPPTLRRLSDVI